MNSPTRVALVGCGFMGQVVHLPNLAALPQCEIVGLVEPRPQRAQLIADKYRISRVYASHLELAEDDTVEAVVTALPHAVNDQVAGDLLRAGKHVFVEKPMAASVAAAQQMIQAARESGALLMVGYMKRYDPGVLEARRIIDELRRSGRLGEMTFARAHCFGGDWTCGLAEEITTDEPVFPSEPTPPPTWLEQSLRRDFDRFINVYSHNTNLLRYLLDTQPVVNQVDLAHNTWLINLTAQQYPVSLECGTITAHAWDEQTRVYFEHGWIDVITPPPLLRNTPAQVTLYEAGEVKQTVRPLPAWKWSFREELEDFLRCIQEGTKPLTTDVDSLRDMELAEEVFRMWQATRLT